MGVLLLGLLLMGIPAGQQGCHFPGSWEGGWHHLMHPYPLNITSTTIDTKGTCHQTVSSDYSGGNMTGFGQFILQEDSGCLKCMIIYQKHFNLLQYRESECLPSPHHSTSSPGQLGSQCREIPGDAAMYTMIRALASPVACPLQGPFSLAYGKGGADKQCSHPPSLMDSCSDASVVQIQYQACPDVAGSESLVERMTCVAKWKEGNKRYFVALVSSRLTVRLEPKERYHCFLYEHISGQMRMAQGQFTGSCRGLWSVLEGKRTFSLNKLGRSESCRLPHFLTQHPKWRSLDRSLSLHLDPSLTSFSFLTQGTTLEQVSCHSLKEEGDEASLVVHVKQGCSSGYMCLGLTVRDINLVTATYGLRANHPEEACSHHYFSPSSSSFSLLVAENTSSPCPFSGSYRIEGQLLDEGLEEEDKQCGTFMQAGCSNFHRLELQEQCGGKVTNRTSLVCHGVWQSANTSQLVLSQPSQLSYHCLAYREQVGRLVATLNPGHCNFQPGANISSSGPCILPLIREEKVVDSNQGGNLRGAVQLAFIMTMMNII